METTVETTDPHTVKLTIEVPEEEFGKDLDRTYRAIANQIKIPGVREGKVPKQSIGTQIGTQALRAELVHASRPAPRPYLRCDREPDQDPGLPEGEGAEADHRHPDREGRDPRGVRELVGADLFPEGGRRGRPGADHRSRHRRPAAGAGEALRLL